MTHFSFLSAMSRFAGGLRRGGLGALAAVALLLGACSYKIEITQGNPKLVEDFKQLELGMSQDDVNALLQVSQLRRLYKKNTWLYVYEQRDAGFIGEYKAFSAELVFDDAGNLMEINVLRDDFVNDASDDGDDGDDDDNADESDESDNDDNES